MEDSVHGNFKGKQILNIRHVECKCGFIHPTFQGKIEKHLGFNFKTQEFESLEEYNQKLVLLSQHPHAHGKL